MTLNTKEFKIISTPTSTPKNSKYYNSNNISNTVFLMLDSNTLCYDRETPIGRFAIKQRVAESLPSKPKVCVVNIFTLNNIPDKEAKIKYLQETSQVAAVKEINYSMEGL